MRRSPDTPRDGIAPLGLIWLALALAIASALRAWLAYTSLGDQAGCVLCLVLPSLGHDAWLLAPGWALLGLAAMATRRWLSALLVAPVLTLLLVMAIDVTILATLHLRLYLFDVFKFGAEGAALGDFLAALLRSSGAPALVLALLGLVACLAALLPHRPAPRLGRTLGVAALLAVLAAATTRVFDPAYISADIFLNVVELHYAQDVNRPYSAEFAQDLSRRDAPLPQQCTSGQQRRPNVMVLAVESLSSYQSALHGGPLALTPELDAIARRGSWFRHFHANGFTTDAGLIALLTGRAPIPAVGRYRSTDAFAGFGDPKRSVAAPLRAAGYGTHFFTTGDLGFLDKAPWLKALGFDHWEGAEHAFYEGWPRGGFKAAEDRALYLRLLQWMQERDAAQPFFAFALTVESHPPFVDRRSGRLDEAAVFAAVDREVGRFVRELEQRGYFEDGLLLITGDHRSMTPLHSAERETWKDAAFARVPLIVLGPSGLPQGAIDAPFQQTDLLPSLIDLIATDVCTTPDQGRFLRPDPQPPAWIMHARGDARNRVDVYFDNRIASLLLAGDDSRWIGQPPPQAQRITDQIHRDRIARGALDSDIGELIEILGR